jgi:membrane protein DedA with SNARE-associated domain
VGLASALAAMAAGADRHTEDDAMTPDTLWISLMLGVVVGMAVGFTAAWRLARKLEFHSVSLAKWDEDDWQQRQEVATTRLRRVAGER